MEFPALIPVPAVPLCASACGVMPAQTAALVLQGAGCGQCRQLLGSPECSWELGDLQGLPCFPGGLLESPSATVGLDQWLQVVQCCESHLYYTSVLNWELL